MTDWYVWGIPVILASFVLLYLLVAVIPRYFRKGDRIFPGGSHFLSEDLYERDPFLRARVIRENNAAYMQYRREEIEEEEEEEEED